MTKAPSSGPADGGPDPVDSATAEAEVRFALLAALGAGGGRHPGDWTQDTPAALLGDVGPAGWQVRLQAAARILEDAGYRCAAVTPEAAAALFGEPLAASVAAIVAGLGKLRPRMTPAGKLS